MANSYAGFFQNLTAAVDDAAKAKVAQTPLLDRVKLDSKPIATSPYSQLTINVPGAAIPAQSVGSGGVTYGSVTANANPVVVNQHEAYPFPIPDMDAVLSASPEEMRDLFIDQGIKTLCESVETYLAGLITPANFATYSPVLDVNNKVQLGSMAALWGNLANNKIPVKDFDNFFLTVHPSVYKQQLQDPNWTANSQVGYQIAGETHRTALLGQQWGAWCDFGQLMPLTTLVAPSVAPTVSATGGGASGGLLAAGTYKLVYTLVGASGETTASPEASVTVAAGNIPQVTFPALPSGYTSQNVYITAPGGASGTEVLYSTGNTGTTANLSAAAPTSSVVPPTTNAKYTSLLHHRNAISMVARPLPKPRAGAILCTYFEYRKIPMRLTIDWYQPLLAETLVIDTLFGASVVRPDFGAICIS